MTEVSKKSFVELYRQLLEEHGMPHSTEVATTQVNTFLDTLKQELGKGHKVSFVNFGVFDVKNISAKVGYNPQTRERRNQEAYKKVSFKSGKGLKEVLK